MTLNDFLSRLEGVKGRDGKYMARCPNHGDSTPSLSVSLGKDNKILLKCFAGCSTEDIVWSMDLQMKDLFAEVTPATAFPVYEEPQRKQSAADKPKKEAEYFYAGGQLKKIKYRRSDGSKYCTWLHKETDGSWAKGRNNIAPGLYMSQEDLPQAIFLVEGEKDVESIKAMGLPAVSLPDGSQSKWEPSYEAVFTGKRVLILPDNDEPGQKYAQMCAANIHGKAEKVWVLDLKDAWPEIPPKGDVTDMIVQFGPNTAFSKIAELDKVKAPWEPPAAEPKKPILMPMSSVEARKAEYLLNPYLPRGMLAIMGGVSGAGKTYLVLSWISAITNGVRLPFQDWTSPSPPSGYVYYFTQENDPNTVIRPRLDLLGANLDKVLIQASNGTVYEPLTLNDPRLEEAAREYPPTMIVFDPIQSYLGQGVEMNKANEVRPILDWLGDFAKRHNCTIVLISHMGKPGFGNASALDRLLGSSDFRNAARSIIIVGRDPENKESRIFAHGKNSIGEPGTSQRYHIDGKNGVVYDGPCDLSADDIVKQSEEKRGRSKPATTLTGAIKQLEELLWTEGYATMEQVDTLQVSAGISAGTMSTARKELGLKKVSIGQPPHRKNWWVMPDVDIEKFKLEHTPPPEQMKIST